MQELMPHVAFAMRSQFVHRNTVNVKVRAITGVVTGCSLTIASELRRPAQLKVLTPEQTGAVQAQQSRELCLLACTTAASSVLHIDTQVHGRLSAEEFLGYPLL
jgi:hypothetical protein